MGVAKDLWYEIEALNNKQDLAGLVSLFADDGVYINPDGRHEGREAITALFAAQAKGMSDLFMETSLLIEDGDTVMGEWTCWCTNTGPLTLPDGTELPPTGKRLELVGAGVATVKDGKLTRMRDYYDNADMARQLGLMPS